MGSFFDATMSDSSVTEDMNQEGDEEQLLLQRLIELLQQMYLQCYDSDVAQSGALYALSEMCFELLDDDVEHEHILDGMHAIATHAHRCTNWNMQPVLSLVQQLLDLREAFLNALM